MTAPDEVTDPRVRLHAAMRRLHRHKQELAKLDALRREEQDRIDAWWLDVSHGEQAEIARLQAEIEAWAVANRDAYTMSWPTPWGTVSTRVTKGRTVVEDEDALIEWCEQNGYLAPPAKPKPDVKALRKDYPTEDGLLVYTDGHGHQRPIPGVRVDGADSVSVTIGGDSAAE